MPESPQDKRFEDLLGRFLDQELEGDELREFVTLVKTNENYDQQLRAQLSIDQKLQLIENTDNFADNIDLAIQAREEEEEFTDKVMQLTEERQNPKVIYPWLITAASLAACLVMAVLFVLQTPNVEEAEDHGIAVISSLTGSLNQNLVKGDSVPAGPLELKEGYLSLEFYGGARVDVVAPAKLDLIDGMKLRCHFGKLKAHVPEVARGFQVLTQDTKVVDLGTEFALNVHENQPTELHVFDGEVEAYDAKGSKNSMRLLRAGEAYIASSSESFKAKPDNFKELLLVKEKEKESNNEKAKAWEKIKTKYLQDKRMLAYYDFEPENSAQRNLKDISTKTYNHKGAIVGAQWTQGPWAGKKALEFKRPSDRVRLNIPGEFKSLTLACWVRFDGLDRKSSSLMLTDGYDLNEVHWQIKQSGSMHVGIHHRDDFRKNYGSPSLVNLKSLGQWMHLATVIDAKSGQVHHYKNGELVSKTTP